MVLAGALNAAQAAHGKDKHKNDPGYSSGGDGGSNGVIFSVAFVGDPAAPPGWYLYLPQLHGTYTRKFRQRSSAPTPGRHMG